MQARHLVTTADERTWPTGQPLLFLGGWCQRWERRNQWRRLDAIVAAPYGLGQQSKDADHAYVRDLETSLFPELCDLLGHCHGTSRDQRYWRIILGHWFRRYIEVIFNRTRTLQSCIAQYSIDSTTVFENSAYSLATNDSYAAIWASNDDRWNHELYVRIMKLMPKCNFRFDGVVDYSGERKFSWQYKEHRDLRARVISFFRCGADRAISLFQADDDLVIVNSYLPRKQELKLQALLGQCPRLLSTNVPAIKMASNAEQRRKLCEQIAGSQTGDVEQMARALLFELLPVCYFEGFSSIKEHCERISWPSRPRAVFTSNNFDTDEIFKSWVADKVLHGAKYITGQHGNNYGTHRHHVYPSIEEITADRFVTWGWEDGLHQHRPAFLLKTVGKKSVSVNAEGDLLLIQNCLPHRLNTWDVSAEFEEYFEDQKRFVIYLSENVRKQLRVRLSPAHKQMGWGESDRWREFDSQVKLDNGVENLGALLAKSRLVVHAYDSTGILETLSQNIPTVAFWQNGLEHVRDSARPWYQVLVDVGIFHLSAVSAAAHVSNVWDDIEGWWELAAVKNARLAFCNQYARTVPHPLQELKNILKFD
jgi:putative transferase (TIGR04331 family)